jgi:hypothetical protein
VTEKLLFSDERANELAYHLNKWGCHELTLGGFRKQSPFGSHTLKSSAFLPSRKTTF